MKTVSNNFIVLFKAMLINPIMASLSPMSTLTLEAINSCTLWIVITLSRVKGNCLQECVMLPSYQDSAIRTALNISP